MIMTDALTVPLDIQSCFIKYHVIMDISAPACLPRSVRFYLPVICSYWPNATIIHIIEMPKNAVEDIVVSVYSLYLHTDRHLVMDVLYWISSSSMSRRKQNV